MHSEQHPLSGQTVTLKNATDVVFLEVVTGAEFRVEDWWDRVGGGSWMTAAGNPAAMKYGIRSGTSPVDIPLDDEVVYGKINGFGHIVHISEL